MSQKLPRHIFVHHLGEDAVICPWIRRGLPVRKCLKCPFNNKHEIIKLPKDELRGKGYIECNYADEVAETPPEWLVEE